MAGGGAGVTEVWCENDGMGGCDEGAGMMGMCVGGVGEGIAAGREWRGRSGRGTTGGGCSWRLTPHLTSPLKGGRDELGEVGEVVGEGG